MKDKLIALLNIIRMLHKYPVWDRLKILFDYYSLYIKKGLDPDEYYNFEFESRSKEFRNTFLGVNEQRFYLDYLNPIKYATLARNKYMAHKLLEDTGVAKSKLICYYIPEGKVILNHKIANDKDIVYSILDKNGTNDYVIKSTESSHGDNVYKIRHIRGGVNPELESIISSDPLIIEEMVKQTSQLSAFNPSSVNTLRFMTALYPNNKAKLICCFIKIGRDGSFVDNAGKGGNIDACIDIRTGEITNVIEYNGYRKIKKIKYHPDNGQLIEGIKIAKWEEIVNKVLHFQECFPYIKVAGWDIAVTEEGPVVIEVNDFWDRTGQLFINKGWREEIRECYYAWKQNKMVMHGQRILTNRLSEKHLMKIINNRLSRV